MDKKAMKRFEDTKDFHEKGYFEDFLSLKYLISSQQKMKRVKTGILAGKKNSLLKAHSQA